MSRSAVRDLAQDPVSALHQAVHLRLASGQRFAALLGRGKPTRGTGLTALVAHDGGITPLSAALPAGVTHYSALTPQLPAAFWYERAIHDLVGLVPDGHPRLDPLVLPHREGAVPEDQVTVELDRLEHAIDGDVRALLGTSSFLDRVRTAGPLEPQLARNHGALGPIGRGSGCADDCRVTRPYDGYHQLAPPPVPSRDAGDAQARMQVRVEEIDTAFDLARHAIGRLPDSDVERLRVAVKPAAGQAVGWAEAPQGEVLYLLELADDGRISYCAPRSASFHNLMLYPSIFVGDILTDFPFNEARFGLSICRWRWPVPWSRSPPGSPRWRSSGSSVSLSSALVGRGKRLAAATSVRWAPPGWPCSGWDVWAWQRSLRCGSGC
ncbi:MAG: hypothetical protein DLM60_14345 [Pseudonocardiales bacterium]|nr:NADH-quinone oxidoreductase subunit C [Actinomycetota bacterium]PZS17087.1 MAG: hypothetical protein DLM60_14345 [Pseudonocardiales bacterium]